jgi:hypothetical protein
MLGTSSPAPRRTGLHGAAVIMTRPFLLMTILVAAACAGHPGSAAEAVGSPLASIAPHPSSPPLIVPTIAYVVPPDTTTRDVPIFIRTSGTNAAIHLSDGIVATGAPPDVLLVRRKDGHVIAFHLRGGAAQFSDRAPRGGRADALVVGSTVYEFSSDELVAIDAQGASRPVPLPLAMPTTVGPCQLQKGLVDLNASGLWAVASLGDHLYAYVATIGNGAIVDLSDGRRLDLVDAGYALAMTTGSDGKLYALTVDERCAPNHLLVRRVDPATMREESIIDTGRFLPVESAALITAKGGSTYVHSVTASGTELLRVDGAGVTSIPLPADSGQREAAAPDGTIYLFAGRARNIVTRFDPSSGTSTTVDAAEGPNGSFVEALFFDR